MLARSLLTGRARYDVIASEPSNPYRAGIASLFTQEFYRAASQRLTGDGVFAQWVQSYEIDARTLAHDLRDDAVRCSRRSKRGRPIVATWCFWERSRGAARTSRPLAIKSPKNPIGRRSEMHVAGARCAWRARPLCGRRRAARAVPLIAKAAINTDDRNSVEFGLARSVGHQINLSTAIRSLAEQIGAARPRMKDDDRVQWSAVETAWVSYDAEQGGTAGAVLQRRFLQTKIGGGARCGAIFKVT